MSTVLLGHPKYFQILHGMNPHTRDRWGRRKVVARERMLAQWERFRQALVDLGAQVLVLPPAPGHPGTVFPANAGLRVGGTVYLSRLNPARAGEQALYREFLTRHQIPTADLPGPPVQWEGEADTFLAGEIYLLTYGRVIRPSWRPRWGWPPYRRVYGFRTDRRALDAVQQVAAPRAVLPLELADERYYHGDTCLCAFGPRREHLMAYLPALTPEARDALRRRFGDRLLPLSDEDAAVFAANAYQLETAPRPTLVITDQISASLRGDLQQRGVDLRLVDVSEFLTKGGGSVKCLLLHLGPTS